MYTYILNYDKDTNRKNPDYQEVYDWLENQKEYKELTESVYFFKSDKYSNELIKEMEKIFYSDDKVILIYIREYNKVKKEYYHKKDSDDAYIYHRDVTGTKKKK